MIVLSPTATRHGDHHAIPSTHSSTRRTLEEIDEVRPRLGNVQNATDPSDLVGSVP
jgi:hypothetical protein